MEMLNKRNAEILQALGTNQIKTIKLRKTLQSLRDERQSLLDLLEELESLKLNITLMEQMKGPNGEAESTTNKN